MKTPADFLLAYLRLRGVDAKQHPVYRELTRVRQYFDKIKALESEPEQRTMVVDKAAAGRFIKHGLVRDFNYHYRSAMLLTDSIGWQ